MENDLLVIRKGIAWFIGTLASETNTRIDLAYPCELTYLTGMTQSQIRGQLVPQTISNLTFFDSISVMIVKPYDAIMIITESSSLWKLYFNTIKEIKKKQAGNA